MADEEKINSENKNRLRKGFDLAGGVLCKECFNKKLLIDDLRLENARLKEKIKRIEKTRIIKKEIEGSAHHPKARPPINGKTNSTPENRAKKGGAKLGHAGNGRSSVNQEEASLVVDHETKDNECPDCGGELKRLEQRDRTIVDAQPLKARRILFRCRRTQCKKCHALFESKPEALPLALYGNRLLSQAAVMHYVHGTTIGRLLDIFGSEVTEGGLIHAFHRLGRHFEKAMPLAIEQFRQSHVRHADETPWRTDGHSGYAWLFSTKAISILEFTDTRSARIPNKIFGEGELGGFLVVDRYAAYNKLPVKIQYCFAHLLRDVEKLEYQFPDDPEVKCFVSRIIPPIVQAMKVGGMGLLDEAYCFRTEEIVTEIKSALRQTHRHLAIRALQQTFLKCEHRLYHWASDKKVPAENNFAERELRPTVIARKVSFGSQSDAGAKTRSSIMSILFTARKRLPKNIPIEDWLKDSLNKIALDPSANIFSFLPEPIP